MLINVNETMVFKMGEIIARLHLAFDECEGKIKCWNNSLLGEMESWIRKTYMGMTKKLSIKTNLKIL